MQLNTVSAGSTSPSERAVDKRRYSAPAGGVTTRQPLRVPPPKLQPIAVPQYAEESETEIATVVHVPLHTVELFPDHGGTVAYHFQDGVHDGYNICMDSSAMQNAEKLGGVLDTLGTLCDGLESEETSAYDKLLTQENQELERAIEVERERLQKLSAMKEKRCMTNLQKVRGLAAEVRRSVRFKDAISAEVKRKLEIGTQRERIQETAQTVLANETLRGEAQASDLMLPMRPLRERDPDIMQYTVMRSHVPRGRNRFHGHNEDIVESPASPVSPMKSECTVSPISSPFTPGAPLVGNFGAEEEEEELTAVSSELELARIMDEVFMFIDVNNDGNIDFQEVKAFTGTLPDPPSDIKLSTMFKVCDKDGSGTIENEEFLALLKQLESALKISARQMMKHFRLHCMGKLFDLLDTDGDKALSINEISGLVRTLQLDCSQIYALRKLNIKMNYSHEDIRTMFKEVDVDESGELDREEFVRFISRLASNVPVSHLMNAFLKGKQAAQEKMKHKKMWFS
eukprot:TRINITY_DN7856_c0_g1_i2.p1 TRINITY_DN7856_c0_g1~~TRINITY_DN7856_c0_g1_i2.p1  ORF type:complete len:513 (+),score=177.55 TRINITY_DN7856_c0_g1_i2:713-2251(+)